MTTTIPMLPKIRYDEHGNARAVDRVEAGEMVAVGPPSLCIVCDSADVKAHGMGRCDECNARYRTVLRIAHAPHSVTVQVGVPLGSAGTDTIFAAMLASDPYAQALVDDIVERSIAADLPRPRCPGIECGSREIRKLDSGGWFCPCGWHGESLTAPPPAPRFAVGDWVASTAAGYAGQVMAVHVMGDGAGYSYDLAVTKKLDDGNAELRTCRRPESRLTLCEAPR